ncbi:MAG: hypothetical protein LQ348_003282 [Seirophora lacunosa]|nr:MAG: hypothetical protein LQ348_003282 [Seirophora lacunosa]
MERRSQYNKNTTLPVPSPPPWSPQEVSRPGSSPHERDYSGHGAFLLKKTEISVETSRAEPFSDDRSSDRASTCSTAREEKGGRGILARFGNRLDVEQSSIHSSVLRSSEDLTTISDPLPFGTTVSIQAAQPVKAHEQKLHEMKGLEQAARKPAEAWGKLAKDPELWDDKGDTLVYFGYQRPHPSFRIKASLLEDTRSEILIAKLEEGFQRSVKLPPSRNAMSTVRGEVKNLSSTRDLPTVFENGQARNDNRVRREIHFPAPDNASRIDILRHHITTRNLFAFLFDRPLIGLTYYQALTDLHERLMLYMPPGVDCTQLLIRYLTNNRLHNVSNDPAAAAGLLAWSENQAVRWLEGWREAFVHCVGMYHDLRVLPDMRDISQVSRALLDRSQLELQARIETCESRLSAFKFDDIWSTPALQLSTLSRRSFDHFQHFLQQYYEKSYKGWPPRAAYGGNNNWLARELVQRLQTDFGSLYNYYVDRSRSWDATVEMRIRENMDANRQDEGTTNTLTKLFLYVDKKNKWPHMPCPYPLLPASAADLFEGKPSKQSIFSTKAKTMEKRTFHACAEASNSLLVGLESSANGLVEAFLRFEKTDLVSEANPREVRQGRWVLLYGILQVLATVSVDTPGLWFTGSTRYFLNSRLKGSPPWRLEAGQVLEGADPTLSHCWTVPRTWKPGN